jgi:hypothetical protein
MVTQALSLFQPMILGRSTIHVGLSIRGDVKYFYPPKMVFVSLIFLLSLSGGFTLSNF